MIDFDELYHIALHPNRDEYPRLVVRTESEDKLFSGGVLSGAPLFFENGYRDEDVRAGRAENVSSVLFDGNNILVNSTLHRHLSTLQIDNVQFFPAVYIDNQRHWHEGYWYVNFLEELDCWCRRRSLFTPPEDPADPFDYAEVKQYALDADVLNRTPESRRVLFKMGGASISYVFLHDTLVRHLASIDDVGAKFVSVKTFVQGMQHRL